jgi:hypothetical protein
MTASASVVRETPHDRLTAALDAVIASDWNASVTVKSADLRAILNTPQPAEQDAREAVAALDEALTYIEQLGANIERNDLDMHLDVVERPFSFAQTMRGRFLSLCEPLTHAAPDGWRPIETAPRDGTPVDLLIGGERWPEYSWSERHNAWTKEVGYPTRTSVIMTKPTHYFVVPAPPAQGARG